MQQNDVQKPNGLCPFTSLLMAIQISRDSLQLPTIPSDVKKPSAIKIFLCDYTLQREEIGARGRPTQRRARCNIHRPRSHMNNGCPKPIWSDQKYLPWSRRLVSVSPVPLLVSPSHVLDFPVPIKHNALYDAERLARDSFNWAQKSVRHRSPRRLRLVFW